MRAVFSPRLLGLHVLAVVLVSGMALMGWWQLGAYADRQSVSATQQAGAAPVPLDDVLPPDGAFTQEAHGRMITVTGRYAAPQVLVERAAGEPWLVTPLQTPAGAAVLVVRGSSGTTPEPPRGTVTVTGSLQPAEPTANPPPRPTSTRVETLNIAQLVGWFDSDLYSGFVVLTKQKPAPRPASALPLIEPPPADASPTAGWRNLMYALQWWIFAAFAVFMWWRIVRDQVA